MSSACSSYCYRKDGKPVVTRCEQGSEETSRPPPSRHDGLRRRSLLFTPRNDKAVTHIILLGRESAVLPRFTL